LLEFKPKINARDAIGYTALHLAVRGGNRNIGCVHVLLKAGAKVDLATKFGETALITAAESEELDCVRALIKSGANPNVADGLGWRRYKVIRNAFRSFL